MIVATDLGPSDGVSRGIGEITHVNVDQGTAMATTEQREVVHGHQEPQQEHHWLEKLLGEWEIEGKMETPNGSETTRGQESVRSVGGLWFVAEGYGEMPGGDHGTTIFTLGYDPSKEKFVGSFIGSMMTHQWVYEGELDEDNDRLVLDTMGPEFSEDGGMTGKIVPYQDVMEFRDEDHRVLKSHMRDKSGKWRSFMEMHYHRKSGDNPKTLRGASSR